MISWCASTCVHRGRLVGIRLQPGGVVVNEVRISYAAGKAGESRQANGVRVETSILPCATSQDAVKAPLICSLGEGILVLPWASPDLVFAYLIAIPGLDGGFGGGPCSAVPGAPSAFSPLTPELRVLRTDWRFCKELGFPASSLLSGLSGSEAMLHSPASGRGIVLRLQGSLLSVVGPPVWLPAPSGTRLPILRVGGKLALVDIVNGAPQSQSSSDPPSASSKVDSVSLPSQLPYLSFMEEAYLSRRGLPALGPPPISWSANSSKSQVEGAAGPSQPSCSLLLLDPQKCRGVPPSEKPIHLGAGPAANAEAIEAVAAGDRALVLVCRDAAGAFLKLIVVDVPTEKVVCIDVAALQGEFGSASFSGSPLILGDNLCFVSASFPKVVSIVSLSALAARVEKPEVREILLDVVGFSRAAAAGGVICGEERKVGREANTGGDGGGGKGMDGSEGGSGGPDPSPGPGPSPPDCRGANSGPAYAPEDPRFLQRVVERVIGSSLCEALQPRSEREDLPPQRSKKLCSIDVHVPCAAVPALAFPFRLRLCSKDLETFSAAVKMHTSVFSAGSFAERRHSDVLGSSAAKDLLRLVFLARECRSMARLCSDAGSQVVVPLRRGAFPDSDRPLAEIASGRVLRPEMKLTDSSTARKCVASAKKCNFGMSALHTRPPPTHTIVLSLLLSHDPLQMEREHCVRSDASRARQRSRIVPSALGAAGVLEAISALVALEQRISHGYADQSVGGHAGTETAMAWTMGVASGGREAHKNEEGGEGRKNGGRPSASEAQARGEPVDPAGPGGANRFVPQADLSDPPGLFSFKRFSASAGTQATFQAPAPGPPRPPAQGQEPIPFSFGLSHPGDRPEGSSLSGAVFGSDAQPTSAPSAASTLPFGLSQPASGAAKQKNPFSLMIPGPPAQSGGTKDPAASLNLPFGVGSPAAKLAARLASSDASPSFRFVKEEKPGAPTAPSAPAAFLVPAAGKQASAGASASASANTNASAPHFTFAAPAFGTSSAQPAPFSFAFGGSAIVGDGSSNVLPATGSRPTSTFGGLSSSFPAGSGVAGTASGSLGGGLGEGAPLRPSGLFDEFSGSKAPQKSTRRADPAAPVTSWSTQLVPKASAPAAMPAAGAAPNAVSAPVEQDKPAEPMKLSAAATSNTPNRPPGKPQPDSQDPSGVFAQINPWP